MFEWQKVTYLKNMQMQMAEMNNFLFFKFKSNFYNLQMALFPIFPAFKTLVNSSWSSQKFWYQFGNSNIRAHVWAIGLVAKPSIALKETSVFSIIIMSLPVRNRKNFVDSKSPKLRIYCIKNLYDALSLSVFGSEKNS